MPSNRRQVQITLHNSVWPVLLVFAAPFFALAAGPVSDTGVHALDTTRYDDPQRYRFLADTVHDAVIVALGESIHLTHEFPLIRIGMARFLNENMGFHVLAFEGSAVDVWATQDRLLNSRRTEIDVRKAQSGLFSIWNTPEMLRLFEYEIRSWNTAEPLYLTAYDIQPGSGNGTNGAAAFSLLIGQLAKYTAPPEGFDAGEWPAKMSALSNSCLGFSSQNDAGIEGGIASLEQFVSRAAPEVEKRFPGLPHATMLRLIPDNLRASLRLCRGVAWRNGGDWRRYKQTRDTIAAAFALQLREAAPAGKLMLWAHVSHVFYDSNHTNTSVGELLHDHLGPALYTVGIFAEGGGTIMLFSDVGNVIGYAPVLVPFGQLRRNIDARCPTDCFMDLRGTHDPFFLTPHRVTFEWFPVPLQLSRDFDGIVWVKHVHAPDLPFGQFISLATLVWRIPVAAILLLAGGVWLWKRIRRRQGSMSPRPG